MLRNKKIIINNNIKKYKYLSELKKIIKQAKKLWKMQQYFQLNNIINNV